MTPKHLRLLHYICSSEPPFSLSIRAWRPDKAFSSIGRTTCCGCGCGVSAPIWLGGMFCSSIGTLSLVGISGLLTDSTFPDVASCMVLILSLIASSVPGLILLPRMSSAYESDLGFIRGFTSKEGMSGDGRDKEEGGGVDNGRLEGVLPAAAFFSTYKTEFKSSIHKQYTRASSCLSKLLGDLLQT